MFSIAFICTANMCRSVMAHAICAAEVEKRGLAIELFSAGTMNLNGAAPASLAVATCLRHGTPVQRTGATYIRHLQLDSIDRFFVMEQKHVKALVKLSGVPPARVSLLSTFDLGSLEEEIADPINKGPLAFERCYVRLRRCILQYLDIAAEVPGNQKKR